MYEKGVHLFKSVYKPIDVVLRKMLATTFLSGVETNTSGNANLPSFCFSKVNFTVIELAKLCALRAFAAYASLCLCALRTFVPSCLTCLPALCAFAPYVPWFLRALIFARLYYALCALYLCNLPKCLKMRWNLLLKAILKFTKRKLKRRSVWKLDEKSFWLIKIHVEI